MTKTIMNLDDILRFSGGRLLADRALCDSVVVGSVAIDSRSVVSGSLFVPLRGEKQDGHLFIVDAVRAGASVIFVDEDFVAQTSFNFSQDSAVMFICVVNTLKALQQTAKGYLAQFTDLLRIAITGSSGKTTTKEFLGSILSKQYSAFVSKGNLNSETGVPLSIFEIRAEHQVALLECGVNHQGEMDDLVEMIQPNIALITNISSAHIGVIGSTDAIIKEKKTIFSRLTASDVAFVPRTAYSAELARGVCAKIFTYGSDFLGDVSEIKSDGLNGSLLTLGTTTIHIPLVGSHNVENVLAALSVARYLAIPVEKMKTGIESCRSIFCRSQIVCGAISYFLDCYNANPDSMRRALEVLKELPPDTPKIIILASMLELGKESVAAHIELCQLVYKYTTKADRVYFFGDDIVVAGEQCKQIAPCAVYLFKTSAFEKLEQHLAKTLQNGDFVFLKGSRGLALERLEPLLQNWRQND